MIEHDDALGDGKRMMVRNRHHPGAELDALCLHGCSRQEHLRRGNGFPTTGMMLTDPEFVVSQIVKQGRQFEVALELQGRMLSHRMVGCEKYSEAKAVFH